MDYPMDGTDESMSTITASTIHALPEVHNSGYGQSQSYDSRPQTSYSDTGFTRSSQAMESHSPSPALDANGRYGSPGAGYQQHAGQQGQSYSRPPSGLSGNGDRGAAYTEQGQRSAAQQQAEKNTSVVIKVGMVGDAQIGKTSLMVKYVEGSWDEDYIQTLGMYHPTIKSRKSEFMAFTGVNFMEKTISIRNTEITFSIWDLGGQREFVNMLPLVCNDAVAILFMFDLTRKSTLNSIKEWYRQGRGFNKTAIPFLVGTKYDHFVNFPREEQEEISTQARRFAKAMKASLIFSSTSHSINVQKIFKIVLSKAFDLRCTIPEIENIGEPLLLYQSVG
ncbi:MAG: septum-promoting GTP-binding protein 1 [Bogoriella megaspora]|nr:MAG: septum-promoting GTP-binding protein 1 [Bogoriella megaspora]